MVYCLKGENVTILPFTVFNTHLLINAEFIKYFQSNEIQVPKVLNYEDSFFCFFDFLGKRVSPEPRLVYISDILQKKIGTLSTNDNGENLNDCISYIKSKIEKGEDINNHLSTRIFKNIYDELLNNWGVKHLHLSKNEATTYKGMKKNRSNYYLLFIHDKLNAYFIDVLPHLKNEGFASLEFLKTIIRNGWKDIIGAQKIPGIIQPVFSTELEIYTLWKNGMNPVYQIEPNENYIVPGVSCAKNKTVDSMRKNLLEHNFLQACKKYIGADLLSIQINSYGTISAFLVCNKQNIKLDLLP